MNDPFDPLPSEGNFGTGSPPPDSSLPPPPEEYPMQFTGDGSTYFRIWIVNLTLTILTLGLYWAWARVRTRRYLYGCTRIAGSSFAYHARPVPLLKGYILLGGLFLAYSLSNQFAPLLSGVLLLFFGLVWPWIYVKAVRFRARYSSWRGVRFGFDGDYGESYRVNLFLNFLIPFTLGLAYPWIAKERRDFLWNNLRLGTNRFLKRLKVGEFWKAYLIAAGFAVVFFVLLMFGMVATGAILAQLGSESEAVVTGLAIVLYFLGILTTAGIAAIVRARLLRYTVDGALVGSLQLKCNLNINTFATIEISNLLLTVLTLGFFAPFATIRKNRYLLESISVIASPGELDALVAGAAESESAMGEVASDLLDFEIGL
jgi:uncharacterized membrane protein YjgN (DUF898 family)